MEIEILLLAFLIDIIVREPPGIKFHPIVWIGNSIERNWKILKDKNPLVETLKGIIFTLIYISIPTLVVYLTLEVIRASQTAYVLVAALILNYCFSISAFYDTVKPIKKSLDNKDIESARQRVKHLVTRDVSKMDKRLVASSTIESIGENICDALIAPIFYYMLFGVPGAVAMRISNLLDGRLGHKTPEKKNIGWFPARLDDLLQFIPARITGLLIVLSAVVLGNVTNSLKILIRDRSKDDGINSGWTIASLAGALNVQLEKPDAYKMGDPGEELTTKKIDQALRYIPATLMLFILTIGVIT